MKENKPNHPKISIIIPCYNSAKYISKCFDILEKQTYTDFEVIVINDCSTDNSKEILEKEQFNRRIRIRLINHERNLGPGCARNTGIDAAQGEFVSFCDADDYYSEDFLAIMVNKALSECADIVMCNCNLVMPNGEIRNNSYTEIFNDKPSKEKYLAYSRTALCYLLIKRSLFDTVRLPAFYNGEDMATTPLLLLKASKITHVNDRLYYYCVRSSSASNTATERAYNDLIRVFEHIEKNWGDQYLEELEYIGIKTILYSAIIVGLKANISILRIKKCIQDFEEEYPKWNKNKYLSQMDRRHKTFLAFIRFHQLWLNKLYAELHTILMRH